MTVTYNDKVVRQFFIATIIWAIVGMLVGVLVAFQLNYHFFHSDSGKFLGFIDTEYLTFGRLRPLHTNAVIFAFVGNMLFCRRLLLAPSGSARCRMASDLLYSKIHFWGWQLIIVAAAITLPHGLHPGQGIRRTHLAHRHRHRRGLGRLRPGTCSWTHGKKRNEPSLYVAIWFYIATIVTVALLYLVNNLQIPTSLTHSYPIFGGVQDALTQWWYGHNAVAFFLTTPILGIMYYFLPKAANRPVYSYRLSIIHFWSLVFIYIWAGPHHLLNTALPQWLQTLGMLFSLMLWAPSWGGMLNGLLTLRGGWAQLRTDPVIKFMAVSVTFYGMATFEGPLLSIRAVNEISHYTDWGIGHVHSGTLGWNGFMAAAMLYWLAPRLWKTKLYSESLANLHFWLGLIGILLYVSSMWVSGITQALMLNTTSPDGTSLTNEFVDTVDATLMPMLFRSIGGTLYLLGFILLGYNMWKTIRSGSPSEDSLEVTPLKKKDDMTVKESFLSDPVTYALATILFMILWFFLPPHADKAALGLAIVVAIRGFIMFRRNGVKWASLHEHLIENYLPFTILTFTAVAIGGVVQLIPSMVMNKADNIEDRRQTIYSPLELAGRDIYIEEGCYNCHSQMIRTLEPDVLRYGDYSRIGESIYDHPFQWGSKRTGPDLAREGRSSQTGQPMRPDIWHYQHFIDPRALQEKSTMPKYDHLVNSKTDFKALPKKIAVQVQLGVPFMEKYPTMDKNELEQHARDKSLELAKVLTKNGAILPDKPNASQEEIIKTLSEAKITALIAYMQKLGHYDEVEPKGDKKASR